MVLPLPLFQFRIPWHSPAPIPSSLPPANTVYKAREWFSLYPFSNSEYPDTVLLPIPPIYLLQILSTQLENGSPSTPFPIQNPLTQSRSPSLQFTCAHTLHWAPEWLFLYPFSNSESLDIVLLPVPPIYLCTHSPLSSRMALPLPLFQFRIPWHSPAPRPSNIPPAHTPSTKYTYNYIYSIFPDKAWSKRGLLRYSFCPSIPTCSTDLERRVSQTTSSMGFLTIPLLRLLHLNPVMLVFIG